MEVSWVKNGNETVHVYVSGADLESRQSPGFKGRTHLDKEALGAGNVSLQLNDVRVSDEGSYQCYVLSKSWFTDSTMKLKVSGFKGRIPTPTQTPAPTLSPTPNPNPTPTLISTPNPHLNTQTNPNPNSNTTPTTNPNSNRTPTTNPNPNPNPTRTPTTNPNPNPNPNSNRTPTPTPTPTPTEPQPPTPTPTPTEPQPPTPTPTPTEPQPPTPTPTPTPNPNPTSNPNPQPSLGRPPRFSLAGRLDSDVTLQCYSEGWFPKPELQWWNVKGADLTGRAVLTEKPGADGLFTLQSALQISEQEADGVICLIRHGKERRVLQTRIHIGGEFFTLVSPSWKGLSVFLIVCMIAFIVLIAVGVYKYKNLRDSQTMAKQNHEAESRGFVLKSEWEQIQSQTVAVTLDPDTAHCRLTVSEDGKRVRDDAIDKNVPNTEQRFDHHPFVLGREGFTSGRRYWEVEVGKRDDWKLGVASESAKRKGVFDLSPKEGYWVLQLLHGHDLSALTDPETPLKVLPPLKVGVHLDYEEGKLSFYRVEDRGVIYTFLGKFSGKLFPLFDPGHEDEELVILNKQDQSEKSDSSKAEPNSIPVDVARHSTLTLTETIVPFKSGRRKLIANLHGRQLTQGHGVAEVTVRDKL
ncbi:butyrophilin subfamily 1 member A1-like isoform X3 [Huso huso]|uniref:Butyrophilin subfamily 1 member A1-like isoform X3 n=1 Tax=Huso huso TaxID=61971 RepID=A0ABR0Y4Y3_HUSHU